MTKTWYPVINYENCTECGICTDQCTHGVYNEAKAPRPVVVKPEECIQGCKGCGSLCPNDAIAYFGDTSKNIVTEDGCGSGCNCGPDSNCGSENESDSISGWGCGPDEDCGEKEESKEKSSCGCAGGNCNE